MSVGPAAAVLSASWGWWLPTDSVYAPGTSVRVPSAMAVSSCSLSIGTCRPHSACCYCGLQFFSFKKIKFSFVLSVAGLSRKKTGEMFSGKDGGNPPPVFSQRDLQKMVLDIF